MFCLQGGLSHAAQGTDFLYSALRKPSKSSRPPWIQPCKSWFGVFSRWLWDCAPIADTMAPIFLLPRFFRINLSGQPVPLGLLVQFSGDWKMFKDTLGMPSHNETRGCCWLCNCTPDRVQEFDLHASWRQNYFDQWDFLMRSWEQQRHMSPIWQFPNFNLKVLRLDCGCMLLTWAVRKMQQATFCCSSKARCLATI